MTPEQKFLKALAEMYQNGYKESDIEKEANDYLASLDQFRGDTEKVSDPFCRDWVSNAKPIPHNPCENCEADKSKCNSCCFYMGESITTQATWTPEVGKLYQNKFNGVVTEIVKIFKDNHEKTKIAHKLIGFDYNYCDAHCDHEEDFIRTHEPIAELEGLAVGDAVWCVVSNRATGYYTIESVFSNNLSAHCGKGWIGINFDGSACMFGNGKQLFWRTADRAERFGRQE